MENEGRSAHSTLLPNTSKFHKRSNEELQGNFFRPNLQPTFLNTARRDLESKKPYNAENYGWLMVLGKTYPYQSSDTTIYMIK